MVRTIKWLWAETFGFDSETRPGILFRTFSGVPSRPSGSDRWDCCPKH